MFGGGSIILFIYFGDMYRKTAAIILANNQVMGAISA